MQKALDKLIALEPPSFSWSLDSSSALKHLGLGASDAPDLIAIAQQKHLEDLDGTEVDEALYDATVHAYRLLAEINDPSHVPIFLDLIPLFHDNVEEDVFADDVVEILSHYGEPAIAPTVEMLHNQDLDEYVRLSCPEILQAIAKRGSAKKAVVQALSDYLNQKHFTRTLNGLVIASLLDLEASSEIDAIRACYEAHLAAINVCGDIEEVEVALGLREERTTEVPNFNDLEKQECHLATKERLGPLPKDASLAERFQYLLDLYGTENSLNDLLAVEGYLTGVLLAPQLILPSKYISLIWDTRDRENSYSPTWENMEDAEFFHQSLMVIHNVIINDLESRSLQLPSASDLIQDGGPSALSYWLYWLNAGIAHWNKSTDPENLSEEVTELSRLSVEIIETELEAKERDVRPKLTKLSKQLASHLSKMHHNNKGKRSFSNPSSSWSEGASFHHHDPIHRNTPKISRNAPCPCGSGKKYKRCCMK